jgi:hypothetical protein
MRRVRSRARSSASSSAAERRTPGSRWTAFTTSDPSRRSDLRSARPTIRSRQRKGEHVVAVTALRRRLVQLDHVLEAEDSRRELVAPEQVVERRQQESRTRSRAVELDAGLDDDRRPAVLHGKPLEPAFGHQGIDVRPGGLRPAEEVPDRPYVLHDRELAQRAPGPHGLDDQRPDGVLLRGNRSLEHLSRKHALGQVVAPLEVHPIGDHQVP